MQPPEFRRPISSHECNGEERRSVLRAALQSGLWLILLGAVSLARAVDADACFGIHVIDEASGRGVPMVTLETVNRIRFVTDSAGWVAFDEPGLLGRRVFFSIRSPGYAFSSASDGGNGVALDTKQGSTVEIKLMRLSVAERLYRVTGQGIYRDTIRLGREAPLPRPNINGEPVLHGALQVTSLEGGFLWIWHDVAGHRGMDSFQEVAALSGAPGVGGLDPSLGIHLDYLAGGPLVKTDEPGSVRLEGLLTVEDREGRAHVLAHYSRFGRDGSRMEHGMAEFNDREQVFEPVVQLGDEFSWQCPRGQAVRMEVGGREYIGFASPFCTTRVPADYEDVLNPAKYEAMAWSADDAAVRWQTASGPISQADEARLVADGVLPAGKARFQVSGREKPGLLMLGSGTVRWNAFCKKWVMIAAEASGGAASAGRIWYGEAESPDGPWNAMKCVVEEPGMSLADPVHHGLFDQEEGRLVYFDCSVSSLAGGGAAMPRYEQNRTMYRLNLADPRFSKSIGSR